MRKTDLILAKAWLFAGAHLTNPLWWPRERRRERRRDVLAASLPWYFRRNLLDGVAALPEGPVMKNDASDKVFTLWLQGEDAAPELVKACFRSMRRHFSQEVLVLDEKTLYDYVDLPPVIMDKYRAGKIKTAHLPISAAWNCCSGTVGTGSIPLATLPLPFRTGFRRRISSCT